MRGGAANRFGIARSYSRTSMRTLQDAAASELRSEGLDVVNQFVDVSQRDSVDELADFSQSRGQISALVHTAGLSPVQASARAIVQVDLLGTAFVLDAFGSVIGEGGAGVVIASMAGTMASLSAEFEHRLATTPTAVLDTLPELTAEMLQDAPTAYLTAKRGEPTEGADRSRHLGAHGCQDQQHFARRHRNTHGRG